MDDIFKEGLYCGNQDPWLRSNSVSWILCFRVKSLGSLRTIFSFSVNLTCLIEKPFNLFVPKFLYHKSVRNDSAVGFPGLGELVFIQMFLEPRSTFEHTHTHTHLSHQG